MSRNRYAFLESLHLLATSAIQERLARLPNTDKRAVRDLAIGVLRGGGKLRRNEKLRSGAVRLIVALLPHTFEAFASVLKDTSSPLWYENHFTMFCSLCREELTPSDQGHVLGLIRTYLLTVRSDAGFAAWKAGELLGNEWRDSRSIRILGEVLRCATHVAGRKAALHGIEHALHGTSDEERKYLAGLIRASSRDDKSGILRRQAEAALRGERCGPRLGV